MQNENRYFDKTHLDLDLAEERGLLHRDYLAHCLRWSHVAKFLNQGHKYKDAIVLDVGCGKTLPLAKLLYVNKMSPKYYVGVDLNKFSIPEMLLGKKIPMSIWSETDVCSLDPEDVGTYVGTPSNGTIPQTAQFATDGRWFTNDGKVFDLPNSLVCYEMLEHVHPAYCRKALLHFKELTAPDCRFFISTPCYNGSAASNHVNELGYNQTVI